jgi:hypothetical protein
MAGVRVGQGAVGTFVTSLAEATCETLTSGMHEPRSRATLLDPQRFTRAVASDARKGASRPCSLALEGRKKQADARSIPYFPRPCAAATGAAERSLKSEDGPETWGGEGLSHVRIRRRTSRSPGAEARRVLRN